MNQLKLPPLLVFCSCLRSSWCYCWKPHPPLCCDPQEARAIVRLLETELYGVPAWISFSCRDEICTNHKERLSLDCVPVLAACPHIAAIGINCTAPKYVNQLLRDARVAIDSSASSGDASSKPVLLCYPNSGEEWDCEDRCWKPGQSSDALAFSKLALTWVNAGARIVGGCCRTTPSHIKELRHALLG